MKVAFASLRSAPGVTTALVAISASWGRPLLLVEASDGGGSLAPRLGLTNEPGMTTVLAAGRNGTAGKLGEHAQAFSGSDSDVHVLVGPPSAEAAEQLIRMSSAAIGQLVADQAAHDVFVDLGRLSPSLPWQPIAAACDRLIVAMRPRVEELQAALHRLPLLRAAGLDPEVVLVGERPYGAKEVSETIGVDVLGVIADDRKSADALAGIGTRRRLERSPLIVSASALAERLRPCPSLSVPLVLDLTETPASSANGLGVEVPA